MSAKPPLRGVAGDQRGFTFLEVLIAAFLLVIVMFGLMQYYVQGRKHMDFEESRRKATAVMQERLDQLRRRPYDSLPAYDGTDTTITVDGRTFTLSHRVVPDFPGPNATTLRVAARWTEMVNYDPSNTFTRSDTMTTMVGRAFPLSGGS